MPFYLGLIPRSIPAILLYSRVSGNGRFLNMRRRASCVILRQYIRMPSVPRVNFTRSSALIHNNGLIVPIRAFLVTEDR
jgi:hypothetical protein